MKMNLSCRIAISSLFIIMTSLSSLSQSIKYNGDIETSFVVPGKFATAQINAATTHGVYFSKPRLFVGAGAAIGWNIDAEFWNKVYPVYGDIRKDFTINKRLITFIDAKAGYSFQGGWSGNISDSGVDYGFYCYPSIGLRFATNQKCGLYLKLGYTYQAATLSYGYGVNDKWMSGCSRHNAGGFSATIGFSFQ